MIIDAIAQRYSAEKMPDILKDYKSVSSAFKADTTNSNKDGTPWWSGAIVEEAAEKDYLCAKALTSIAVLNGPTDLDEINTFCYLHYFRRNFLT